MKSNLDVLCKPHKPRYVKVEKGLSKNSPAFGAFTAFEKKRMCLNGCVLFFYLVPKQNNDNNDNNNKPWHFMLS